MSNGKPSEKPSEITVNLLARFREAGVVIPGPDKFWAVRSLRTGRNQRNVGAWSWCLMWTGPESYETSALSMQMGGYFPAKDCGRPGADYGRNKSGNHELDPPLSHQ
jgi:hypothetical protein